MAKNQNNKVIVLVVVIVCIFVIYMLVKKLKEKAQDLVANTPAGWLGGVRTVAADGAFKKLMAMKFLTHSWITKAGLKYNAAPYEIKHYLTQTQANEIARALADSNSNIPGGFFDDSNRAESEIFSIQNWVQAAQVADAYYNLKVTRHKDLNRGLAWLSNESMVRVADYLSNIPTGVYLNGVQIKKENITV